MPNFTTTPYMGLTLPTPGLEPGPQYGVDQNNSFTLVDQHTHIPGQGLPIPAAGLLINGNLPFNNFSLTNVNSISYHVLGSQPSTHNATYVFGGDFYYNNSSGTPIKLAGAANFAVTNGVANDAINSTSYTPLSGIATPITATGTNPISVLFTQQTGQVSFMQTTSANGYKIRVLRNAVTIYETEFNGSSGQVIPIFNVIDYSPSVGVNTYTVQALVENGADTISFHYCSLFVLEL